MSHLAARTLEALKDHEGLRVRTHLLPASPAPCPPKRLIAYWKRPLITSGKTFPLPLNLIGNTQRRSQINPVDVNKLLFLNEIQWVFNFTKNSNGQEVKNEPEASATSSFLWRCSRSCWGLRAVTAVSPAPRSTVGPMVVTRGLLCYEADLWISTQKSMWTKYSLEEGLPFCCDF